jgi:NTE family protein
MMNNSLKKENKNDNSTSSLLSLQSSTTNDKNRLENVLILQGGGSLGAFGCGVFKALANNNIKFDIVAGTSIGGINAAIIAGCKDEKHQEQALEQFWLELSQSFLDLDEVTLPYSSSPSPQFVEEMLLRPGYYFNLPSDSSDRQGDYASHPGRNTSELAIKMKQLKSFYSSAFFGNDKMFKPRWRKEYILTDPEYFAPQKWTYIYDHSPLIQTLEKYVDYDKLKPNGNAGSRLILTAVNVLTAEPLTFDSFKQQITPKHILATSAYPLYNFRWIEIEDGVYAWDGGLLSNTPLR